MVLANQASDLLSTLFTDPPVAIAFGHVIVGLFLLSYAADKFVDGAAGIAKEARLSPVVVGAVIVGFGTSAPELLVSGLASWDGKSDLAVGNIVGSNVANLSLVLGVAAFLVPILATKSVIAKEAPLSLMAAAMFAFFVLDGLVWWEGVVLLTTLVAMLSWTIFGSRSDGPLPEETGDEDDGSIGPRILETVLGLLGTVLGAHFLVTGATTIADWLNLAQGFVGFTLVALGTSLPELVTGVVAARKGETDLLLGNLLGSNIFNSLAVGGAVAILGSGDLSGDRTRTISIIAMMAVSVIAWTFIVTRQRLHKVEAVILVVIWLSAIAVLAQGATDTEDSAAPTGITKTAGLTATA